VAGSHREEAKRGGRNMTNLNGASESLGKQLNGVVMASGLGFRWWWGQVDRSSLDAATYKGRRPSGVVATS
jgi:hypothetical protein